MRRPVTRNLTVLAVSAAVVSVGAAAPPAAQSRPAVPKTPVAVGYGGAVASVDPDASAAGIEVLRKGGNAVDAAVATAALGVTEPYSAGIGGGGYFVHYDAKSRTVHTIDGRETAPLSADEKLFTENGKPIPSPTPSAAASPSAPGHARHLAAGPRRVGQPEAVLGPRARRAPGPGRLHRRRDLSAPRPPPTSSGSATSPTPPSCSCPVGTPGRRQYVQEPGPGTHVQGAGARGRRRALPRRTRRGHRRDRGRAARRPGVRLEGPPRRPDRRGPRGLRGRVPGAHPDLVPRPERLLHRPLVLRRHHGRRGPQHPGAHRLSRASKARYLHRFIEASRIAFADRAAGWATRPSRTSHEGAAVAAVRRLAGSA